MTSLFVALGLAILIALFALQNTFPVTIQFLFWEYQTSLVLVILGSTAIGAALSAIAALGVRWRHGRETRLLTTTLEEARKRIAELERRFRDMP
ncbi:MAG: LapA family protein [Nitrospira sp.]|nr:LapA family protein [Nitrospira sp.]MDH4370022.1 LapA family protein [Nitrospira sp.]MDH5347196.1 LapA family protein [Nitrospira sp.]MDH5498801.1 LapA family protein [Nitrospira sp.]